MDKNIGKNIKRSRLFNMFLKSKCDTDWKVYNLQKNLCVSLSRQAQKQFFSNLNTHDVTDNKTFCDTVKSLLTDKVKIKSKVTLMQR